TIHKQNTYTSRYFFLVSFGILIINMESLGKIFGSTRRVKIMRLFLFNETTAFDIDDIGTRSRVKKADARKEINTLLKIGFLKKKTFTKKVPKKTKKKKSKPEFRSVKKQGWILNKSFDIIKPLRNLLIESELIKEKEIIKHIKKSGTIKLLVLSGIFTEDDNRKLDVLVVGNKIKKE